MKKLSSIVILAFAALVPACGGATPAPVIQPQAACSAPPADAVASRCSSPRSGTFGVLPLRNETKQPISTDGTEDLLISAMSDTGCFTILERDKLAVLIDEMSLCSDQNKDKDYFDCTSFAQKGHLLGVTQYVVGDIVAAEPDIKGAELAVKIPGVGGIDAGTSYGWMQINVRVLDVENGQVRTSTVVNAFVAQAQGGLALSGNGFDLKATAHSNTAQGCALQGMLAEATRRLQASP